MADPARPPAAQTTGPTAAPPGEAGPARTDAVHALAARAAVWASKARGPGTLRAYRSAWQQYTTWCERLGFVPLGAAPEVIGLYLTAGADRLTATTLRVHLAAIATAHRVAGLAIDPRHPRIAEVLEGITRTQADRRPRQAAAVPVALLRRLVADQPDGPLGTRNRAMLLLGFGGALRRSELVALRLADVTPVPGRGVAVTLRRSKTDQHGGGDSVAIAAADDPTLCALQAVNAWLAIRQPDADEAPFFCALSKAGRLLGRALSDKAVVRVVKDSVARAGLDPAPFSGHSLRAGLATAAVEAGAELVPLMRQTRHKSTEAARRYVRTRDQWRDNVTALLFSGPD